MSKPPEGLRHLVVSVMIVATFMTSCGDESIPAAEAPSAATTSVPDRITASSTTDTATSRASTTQTKPSTPEAEIRPDLFVAEPSIAPPGALIELRYAEGVTRGTNYLFEHAADGIWTATHQLTSGKNGDEPVEPAVGALGDRTFGGEDLLIGDNTADTIRLPDDAAEGNSRICTHAVDEKLCTELVVSTVDG